ncbi:MAG: PKD domain-containing protein, partial [Phaeodactylibacter sp.]|nr:PKD domain-containing protein [Phaeodactylibacter sp.]
SDSCSNGSSLDITITPAVSVEIDPVAPACEDLSFVPGATVQGTGLTYNWTFGGSSPGTSTDSVPPPIAISQPDTFDISLVVSGNCGTDADTIEIIVQTPQEVVVDPIDDPLCEGGGPVALSADIQGGTWSGAGIIDGDNGVFEPQEVGPGLYEVVYTLTNGACINQDTLELEVVASALVNAQDESYCVDAGLQQLTATPLGGVWSGPGVNSSGSFNPFTATPDIHTLTYTYEDANGCEIQANATIEVQALPVLSFSPLDSLCIADVTVNLGTTLNATGTPDTGVFSWAGPGVQNSNGNFNSGGLAPGDYFVTVTYDQDLCAVTDSLPFSLFSAAPLELSPDTAVCITDGMLQLNANFPGGVWSGDGIDAQTGVFEFPETAGTYGFQYIYAEGTNCVQEANVEVTLIDLTGAISIGDDEFECEGLPNFQLGAASPANGVWQGPGVTNGSTGLVDLSVLEVDSVYSYEYCIESQNAEGCQACESRDFIIHPLPEASFSVEGLPCIGLEFSLDNNSEGAVSFNWDLGNGTTSTESEPVLSYATPGTYQITLEAETAFGCTDQVDTSLYITTAPNANFALDETEGCAPFEVQVSNASSGDIIDQFWEINGDTIVGPDLEGIILDGITTDTIFNLILTVQNLCGPDTQLTEILVHPYPLASFGVNADEGCTPFEVDFANNTLGEAETYIWTMGNGNTYSDSIPPNQVYTTTDTSITSYTISLVAINACGIDTATQEVTA